jgi:peptidoglycan/xylan/chitin deacetylase (PgdA/CDA1 family)
MTRWLVTTLLLLLIGQPGLAQTLAITLDDLPYALPSRTSPQQGRAQASAIVAALAKHDIRATGFVVGRQLNWRSRRALRVFATAGHGIGNHSWSHPDYGTLTPDEFHKETARTDRALGRWITSPKYYRFPYLREGESEAAKQAADTILGELGYQNVPVTIDTDDWKYNADYLDALDRGQTGEAARIAGAYLTHLKERTTHFRRLALDSQGREVAHILLLHLNQINADHLGTLLDWYAAEGWRFITVQEAMADPIYSALDLYAGPRGLSQIERVTRSLP